MVTVLDQKFEGILDHPFTFSLDEFQKHSIKLIQEDMPKNILVCCHTGSGKSLVAEYAIIHGVRELKKKVIYTSPIKTLSNQKFFEFTNKYTDMTVGLITGDHKCNPNADCLIMTTEILSNMLIYNSLKMGDSILEIDFNDFYAVIFDECHYINDVERGGIWEKCIMNLPKHISQILLSATIDKPLNLIEWIQTCNGNNSYLLTNEKRVVPLNFNYSYWITQKKISKELEQYADKLNKFNYFADTNTKSIEKMYEFTMTNINRIFEDNRSNSNYIINEICKQLQEKNMTPAIFFIFSKKKCLEVAKIISTNFNDYNEGVEVDRLFGYYLSKLDNKDAYLKSHQYHIIRDLAIKGIAIHHSGLIPVFKEIIEMLFSKNLIKILFATETFAVGLNMPTKTVIFTDVYKFDNNGKRRLHPHEFIQMSGRAGRRGIDTIGYVILTPQLFSESTSVSDLRTLMFGGSQKISSKFNIDNELILQLLENIEKNNEDVDKDQLNEYVIKFIKSNVDKTLLKTELLDEITVVDKEKKKISKEIEEIKIVKKEIFEEYQDLVNKMNPLICPIQPSKNQIKKMELKIKEIKKDSDFQREFAKYEKLMNLQSELSNINKYSKQLEFYIEDNIGRKLQVLIEDKFVKIEEDKYKLDTKGKVARKIKEIDCIIGTEIFTSKFIDELFSDKKIHKIIALLALLTEGRDNDYIELDPEYYDLFKFLDNFSINVNREMVKPVLDWYDGSYSKQIVEIYEIQEGDLVKIVNKIIHVIDNVIDVYLMINKVEHIEVLNGIKEKINRDIMGMESLYLKLA